MRDLNFTLKNLCRQNPDGCFSTRAKRAKTLNFIANQLHEIGYRHMLAKSLKSKHVEALVKYWLESGLTAGTVKMRMSVLRWWAKKINKPRLLVPTNDYYGIPRRKYLATKSKAQFLDPECLAKIKDDFVRIGVELQQQFGLRREECIKFQPSYADQKTHIRLKGSWTKGGRPRIIPILTEQQRKALDRAHTLAGNGSLIPSHLRYVNQLYRYSTTTYTAGLRNLHGLRHGYAQRRFRRLAGWDAPVVGGPHTKDLSPERRVISDEARMIVSSELGHNRIKVTSIYLGN